MFRNRWKYKINNSFTNYYYQPNIGKKSQKREFDGLAMYDAQKEEYKSVTGWKSNRKYSLKHPRQRWQNWVK